MLWLLVVPFAERINPLRVLLPIWAAGLLADPTVGRQSALT
jgi:hypothetical protein